MVHDVIERFRYRFQLWRRERGADWGGPEGNRVTAFEPPPPIDPKHTAILTDSTPTFVVSLDCGISRGRCALFAGLCRSRVVSALRKTRFFHPLCRLGVFLDFAYGHRHGGRR